MTAWYAKGELGEYVLGEIEEVINGGDRQVFCQRMEQIGLTPAEIRELMIREEIYYYG